jgi:uncharacterized protein YqgV (UPF0045/DUF77 family)
MLITVEISLYPLTEQYAIPIKEFIGRLKNYEGIQVIMNATSTQIVGEHSHIFEILSKETEKTFASGKHVFIMKVIGFERDITRYQTIS